MKPSRFTREDLDWRRAVASELGPASPVTRHVLLTLSLYMSPKGDSCFPSIETLCVDTGLSKPTVVKHLKLASQNDQGPWILVTKHGYSGQGWARNDYVAVIPKAVKNAFEAGQSEDKEAVKEIYHDTGKGGKAGTTTRLTSHEKAVKEVNSNSSIISPKNSSYTFDQFWIEFDKKTGKEKCRRKWGTLRSSDKAQIRLHVPKYVAASPNPQFRKNPLTYLNSRAWEDEYLPPMPSAPLHEHNFQDRN